MIFFLGQKRRITELFSCLFCIDPIANYEYKKRMDRNPNSS